MIAWPNGSDDDMRADFDWLASQCKRIDSSTAEEDGNVYWECGEISFTCDVWQEEHGAPLEAFAVDWRIGWEPLPRAMNPLTRGEFRTLCRMVNK